MKKLRNTLTICIAIVFLQLGTTVSAQSLYTKESGCTDPPWKNNVEKKLKKGSTSTNGVKGCDIDVNQCHPEISSSPYANRAIEPGVAIHTLGNSTVERKDFHKWTRWYQEDGNTQVFRLFKDEINVRNSVSYKPRIEAEFIDHVNGTKVYNDAKYAEWTGTYTVIKPPKQSVNIFQIWGSNNYALMLELRPGGKIVLNRRYGAGTKTMINNATGKSFEITVRDYGTKWEVYLNGEFFDDKDLTKSDTPKRNMKSHFRWGMYHSDKKDGPIAADCMIFVTGARFRYSNQSYNNNDNPQNCGNDDIPPTVSFNQPSGNITVDANYSDLYVIVDADDNVGVENIELFIDGNPIRTESVAPYEWGHGGRTETLGLSEGVHTFTAVAKDAANNSASTSIQVTVGDPVVQGPAVSFNTPSGDITLEKGYGELVVQVDATDADGSISYVELFVDNEFLRRETYATYDWGHNGSDELLGLDKGVHYIKAVATDNDGNEGTAQIKVTVTDVGAPEGCEYPAMSSTLPSIDNDFKYVYKIGSGYPALSNFKKFGINWDLTNGGLYQFSMNTTDGNPDYYVDLRSNISNNTLEQSQPGLTISGSPFAGLDGSYYVLMDGDNIVLSEKSGAYSLYFSNSATPPCPEAKNKTGNSELSLNDVEVYPVPFKDELFIELKNAEDITSIELYNTVGLRILTLEGADIKLLNRINIEQEGSIFFVRVNSIEGTMVKSIVRK